MPSIPLIFFALFGFEQSFKCSATLQFDGRESVRQFLKVTENESPLFGVIIVAFVGSVKRFNCFRVDVFDEVSFKFQRRT